MLVDYEPMTEDEINSPDVALLIVYDKNVGNKAIIHIKKEDLFDVSTDLKTYNVHISGKMNNINSHIRSL